MRKDDVMHKRLQFKARRRRLYRHRPEKARVPRTIRKGFGKAMHHPVDRLPPRAMVNHHYFYCVDEDSGFIKFCSYFPYGKLCINGHESISTAPAWRIELKRFDNGLCAVRTRGGAAHAELSMKRRSRAFSASGSQYCANLIQRQTERPATGFGVAGGVFPSPDLGSPAHGRQFFEEVIRENIDLGRDPKRS